MLFVPPSDFTFGHQTVTALCSCLAVCFLNVTPLFSCNSYDLALLDFLPGTNKDVYKRGRLLDGVCSYSCVFKRAHFISFESIEHVPGYLVSLIP